MNPDRYNIALDCIDKHANSLVNKHKTALTYIKEESPGKLREPPLQLSFSSLQGLTNAAAHMFQSLGIQKGERVVLRLPNSPEFPINFLGAIKAGAIPIPTSALLTRSELEFILNDSGASALVMLEDEADPFNSAALPNLRHILVQTPGKEAPKIDSNPSGPQIHRWQNLIKQASAQFETETTSAEDPAFWLYTSGTTAKPKAVIHAHRSIRAHDARARLWQDVKAGDTIFNTSSLNWSYALTCGMLDLWRHGLGTVIFQGELQAANILRILRRCSVTTFMSVPGIYRRLLNLASPEALEQAFTSVRICLSAGESLSEKIRNDFQKATERTIYEGLGMTEHSVYLVQAMDAPPVVGSCGRPLPEQRIAILREDLSECAPDEIGMLASHRSCPGLMLGYHQRPQESETAFRGDWFISGDLAQRNSAGDVFYLGRGDDLINAGGYRISPLEVEAKVNELPYVAESAVVGIEREPGKTLVHAFVVLNEGTQANQDTEKRILEDLSAKLAKYKIPRQVVFLKMLPKTANGKLQRALLRPR